MILDIITEGVLSGPKFSMALRKKLANMKFKDDTTAFKDIASILNKLPNIENVNSQYCVEDLQSHISLLGYYVTDKTCQYFVAINYNILVGNVNIHTISKVYDSGACNIPRDIILEFFKLYDAHMIPTPIHFNISKNKIGIYQLFPKDNNDAHALYGQAMAGNIRPIIDTIFSKLCDKYNNLERINYNEVRYK